MKNVENNIDIHQKAGPSDDSENWISRLVL